MKKALTLVLILLFLFSAFAFLTHNYSTSAPETIEQCYVGVAFCGNTTAEAKLLIDRVKTYTNLFVLQSGPISENETATNEICDYAVSSGLNIVVYFGDLTPRILQEKNLLWRLSWLNNAQEQWGEKVLGVYLYDEPGGIYLDYNWTEDDIWPRNATLADLTYDSIANLYNRGFKEVDPGFITAKRSALDVFVSDYALYWFDYLAGYDVVLAQIGWNHTMEQDIALVRGAAHLQNKTWGAVITWKYNQPPYLDTGENIYRQMQNAYQAGAKYIVIFNYPTLEGNEYGVMTDEHFEALEQFWHAVVKNPTVTQGSIEAEAVLVLPNNYGWGMRHPEDKIWGWWGPDEKSPQIWALSRELLLRYGLRLDMVYDDSAFPVEGKYEQIYYWNQTVNFG